MTVHYLESYGFSNYIGYGRYAAYLLKGMKDIGMDVWPVTTQQLTSCDYVKRIHGINDNNPIISVLTPMYLQPLKNPRYLYTMTEGSEIPDFWVDRIQNANVKHIFVPSEYCRESFSKKIKNIPITTILGGTEPSDFEIITENVDRPFTFMALADRGDRKGWIEVWDAFWTRFATNPNVRLIIKYRGSKDAYLLNRLKDNPAMDSRIIFLDSDFEDVRELYKLCDCFVIPSHAEGWGMPHREAAMCGVPVITLKYSGMDDGNIENWAYTLYDYQLTDVPKDENLAGKCARCDITELADMMYLLFHNREYARNWSRNHAATWLRENQTWEDTATALREVLNNE